MPILKRPETFDLSTTTIENIFLDEFMPYAPLEALRVYLAALRLLSRQSSVEPEDLAVLLKMEPEAIERSLQYWKEQGILQVDRDTIEFLSLRSLYLEENFNRKTSQTSIELDGRFQKLFDKVNSALPIPLQEMERRELADFIKDKELEDDVVALAFQETKTARYRTPKALESLRQWISNGVRTLDELMDYKERFHLRMKQYKQILSAIGQTYAQPTLGDRECIDRWLDEYNFPMEAILEKLTDITKRTRNPSMNYIDAAFRNEYQGRSQKRPTDKEDDLMSLFRK